MDCREVMVLVNKYFENRISDIEEKRMKNHIDDCGNCREMYHEMGEVFSLLNEHSDFQLVKPPNDFTNKVMNKVNIEKKIINFKKLDIKRWGASFVAAGIIIGLINFGFINYDIEEIVGEVHKSSVDINRKIYDPITKFGQLLSMENITSIIKNK